MTITLNSSIICGLQWTQKSTDNSVSTLTDAGSISIADGDIQSGSGLTKANTIWHNTSTLSAGGSDTIDLSGLTRELFGDSYDISLIGGVVKSVSINNISSGDISWDFSIANAFDGPLSGGTDSLNIPGRSAVSVSNVRDGWPVSSSQRYIKISDIDSSGCVYEIAVLAVTGI
jgi:hypothetical protein